MSYRIVAWRKNQEATNNGGTRVSNSVSNGSPDWLSVSVSPALLLLLSFCLYNHLPKPYRDETEFPHSCPSPA